MRRISPTITFFFLSILTPMVCMAAMGDVLYSNSNLIVNRFVLDSAKNRIYASVSNQNGVVIIDAATLTQVGDVIFVGSAPMGLALSEDGGKLFIALSGSKRVGVLDTSTMTTSQITTPEIPYDIEVGLGGRLYITPNSGFPEKLMQIDSSTGADLGSFDLGVSIYKGGFLEISKNKNILYFGNSGLSPGTLAKIDVSSQTPSLIYKNPHGELGSNGQGLTLSHDNDAIYYPCGSGNGTPPYTIFKIATTDMSASGSLNCGAYPRNIALSPDDKRAYVVHESGYIDVFNATTYLPVGTIATGTKEATELIVDKTGRRLFAAFDNALVVYDTGASAAPVANAGSNQIVYDTVSLDASKSTDSDGTIVSYFWELKHKDNSVYNKTATGAKVNLSGLNKGFYDVVLTVTDNSGAQSSNTIWLAVSGDVKGDVNADKRIGLEEAIYALQVVAGLK